MQKVDPAQNFEKDSTELIAEERGGLAESFENLSKNDLDFLYQLSKKDRAKVAEVFNQKNKIADARGEGIKNMAEKVLIDGLTGIDNRKSFDKKIKEEVARAERYKIPLSLIFADIDFFKKVNDTFGHPAADEVLKKFAAVLKKGVRKIDFPARFGGDEFVVILPETDLAGAVAAAEKLRAAVEKMEIKFKNQEIKITASFGAAEKIAGEGENDLVARADAQLYSAKKQGRDCVVSDLLGEKPQQKFAELVSRVRSFFQKFGRDRQ